MNTYEVLIIFKPILDVENVDAILNHFQKNIVEANQGEVVEIDRIGRKRLAYEIKKFKDGFLTLFLLKLPPAKVADFKRACQLNDDVLRVTLVRQDEIPTREALREDTPLRREDGRREEFGRRDFRGGGGPRRDFGPPRRDFGGPREGGPPPRRDFNNAPPREGGVGMPPREAAATPREVATAPTEVTPSGDE